MHNNRENDNKSNVIKIIIMPINSIKKTLRYKGSLDNWRNLAVVSWNGNNKQQQRARQERQNTLEILISHRMTQMKVDTRVDERDYSMLIVSNVKDI